MRLVLVSATLISSLLQPSFPSSSQYEKKGNIISSHPCLHPVINAMIYRESLKDPFWSLNTLAALSVRAHDYVSTSGCLKFPCHC